MNVLEECVLNKMKNLILEKLLKIDSYDTNVTHHLENLLNKEFQRCSTIEWE